MLISPSKPPEFLVMSYGARLICKEFTGNQMKKK